MGSDSFSLCRGCRAFAFIALTCLLLPAGVTDGVLYAQNSKQNSSSSSALPGTQKITIKGTITDDHGEPLAGANVLVKGTSVGTSADIDGNYSLTFQRSTRKADVLVFSFIGTEPQEFNVSSSTRLNVTLKVSSLDAVVVNGFYLSLIHI